MSIEILPTTAAEKVERLAQADEYNQREYGEPVGWVCDCNEWWDSPEAAEAVLSEFDDSGNPLTADTCRACR